MNACVCGHDVEDHGHDPDHPGSTTCDSARWNGKPCDCIAYEENREQYPGVAFKDGGR